MRRRLVDLRFHPTRIDLDPGIVGLSDARRVHLAARLSRGLAACGCEAATSAALVAVLTYGWMVWRGFAALASQTATVAAGLGLFLCVGALTSLIVRIAARIRLHRLLGQVLAAAPPPMRDRSRA